MIDDALERLRRNNPVPDHVPTESFDDVLARLPPQRGPRRRWRSRLLAVAAPALAVGAALAVAAVAIVLTGHQVHSASHPSELSRSGAELSVPRSRMLGVVSPTGAAFPAPGSGLISIEQCYPCRAGRSGGVQRDRMWTAITEDSGRSWSVRRTPAMGPVSLSGIRDGWAVGGYFAHSGGFVGAYVTHNGGRTFSPASSPHGWWIAAVSVAGDTVWATAVNGSRCTQTGSCASIVLRGAASGSSLSPVSTQPLTGYVTANIQAASADTAYIDSVHAHEVQHLVTRDGGRSWQTLPKFCPVEGQDTTLTVDSPSSLWRFCWDGRPPTLLGHSDDGGVRWQSFHLPAPGTHGAPYRFQAISPEVAWEMTDNGVVMRITRGGANPRIVWSRLTSQQTKVNGVPATFTATSAATAEITVIIPPPRGAPNTGTYLAIYQTRNAGRTWQASTVPLPPT